MKLELLRPDDLLHLHVEARNLELELSDPEQPVLRAADPTQPSYLTFTFPPQTIVEEAYFESATLKPPPEEQGKPFNKPPGGSSFTGTARSRIGRSSRLVFRVRGPIPYSLAGLLDWRDFELCVSPVADIRHPPTVQERSKAPALSAPGELETSIEIPYRLILSPRGSMVWDHALLPVSRAGRSELWHTRLAFRSRSGEVEQLSRARPASLRAIWSPDFNHKKFWAHEKPVMGQGDLDWDGGGVLTAMTPSDRHEIVVLTSAFHGFIKGLTDEGGTDYGDFVPTPIFAEQLMLSSLGGWLKSRGNWRPPTPWKSLVFRDLARREWEMVVRTLARRTPHARGVPDDRAEAEAASEFAEMQPAEQEHAAERIDVRATSLKPSGFAIDYMWPKERLGEKGDSLNVSEWVHVGTQGRDHYVRIVYEGFVYPFRHRASLVKVTERKVRDDAGGRPVAYMVQRMFVVVRQPLMDYSQARRSDEQYGRAMPFEAVRFTTMVTPDIDLPVPIAGEYSFWINVGGAPFRFHAVGRDLEGNSVDFTAALIFVPFSDYKSVGPPANKPYVSGVRSKYLEAKADRACPVPGQKVTFAPRLAGAPDNTTLTTSALHFTTDEVESKDSYVFRPLLFKGEVNLPAVEQILGKRMATEIAFYADYVKGGFDAGANSAGLFATLVKETTPGSLGLTKLNAAFNADQAGGISTPDLSIAGLARQSGPVAGDNLAAVASNVFDPSDFFKDFKNSAKLFGSISLLDLLPTGTLDGQAPKLQHTEVPEPTGGRKLVATLTWEPTVQPAEHGIIKLLTNGGTKLVLDGRIERVIKPSGAPPPAHSSFKGTLSDFTIEFVKVVQLDFNAFSFTAETGTKTQVHVDMASQPEFKGELSFVNELRKVIPPGLFGDGASLDVTPALVRAGFAIGVPPLSVGVFSLQNLSLAAALELPFTTGLPLFDFNVSAREHPFNLTVAFLGGGGFFHLQIDTDGVRQLEVSFEFGASCSINLGVASGGVHIMAGIYFAMGKKNGKDVAVLAGFLRMGGELSVLGLISVSLEFVLSFGYEDGKAAGRATLTVKVEVLCFSKSVEISVEKKFGGSGGDPKFFEVFDTAGVWMTYAGAFA